MVKSVSINRGDVVLVNLDPTIGKEIQKTRSCLVVSPDELNEYLRTFIVAPMTAGEHSYPFRVGCRFQGKNGYVVADQIRTIDRERVVRTLGKLSEQTVTSVLGVLQEMFAF
jgi:mRNA interferase MazF